MLEYQSENVQVHRYLTMKLTEIIMTTNLNLITTIYLVIATFYLL